MRHIIVLTLVLLTGPVAVAYEEEAAKPNTLTSNEIADGWIRLFDGETKFGWKIDGEAKVQDGQLVLGGGAKATKATLTTRLGDCELRFDHRQGSFGKFGFAHDSFCAFGFDVKMQKLQRFAKQETRK